MHVALCIFRKYIVTSWALSLIHKHISTGMVDMYIDIYCNALLQTNRKALSFIPVGVLNKIPYNVSSHRNKAVEMNWPIRQITVTLLDSWTCVMGVWQWITLWHDKCVFVNGGNISCKCTWKQLEKGGSWGLWWWEGCTELGYTKEGRMLSNRDRVRWSMSWKGCVQDLSGRGVWIFKGLGW